LTARAEVTSSKRDSELLQSERVRLTSRMQEMERTLSGQEEKVRDARDQARVLREELLEAHSKLDAFKAKEGALIQEKEAALGKAKETEGSLN
jgi:hypothetical protein